VYQFLWHELCDWYLEIAKRSLYQKEDPLSRAVTQQTLVETLDTTLRLLHPFMPFISEDIWQRLPRTAGAAPSIMVASFPKASRKGHDAEAEAQMGALIAIVSAIRTIRSESRIAPAVELAAIVRPTAAMQAAITEAAPLISALARATITVDPAATRPSQSALAVAQGAEVYVRLEGVVDLAAERQRLGKEVDKTAKEIAFLEGKLGRPDFVERAPPEIVARERERLAEQRELREKLAASLAALS
jgi:valyl-tRNA synthetase